MVRRAVHAGVSDDLDLLAGLMEPGPGKRFVAVSAHGAGEAALALAALGADEVLAHDIVDPAMLARLVDIKATAAGLLGREDYLVLMGLRAASPLRRRALTRQLLLALSPAQRAYWTPRRGWLEKGLFRADQVAMFFEAFKTALRLLAPESARRQILTSTSREARVRAFRRYVERPWLKRSLSQLGARINLFFPRAEWRASEYPKAFNKDPLGYLERLVDSGLAENPLFAHHVLDPDVPLPEELLPPQLRTDHFDGLRAGASRVRVLAPEPGTLELRLATNETGLAGAYLSNVVDYLEADQRAMLFAEIHRVLEPGAPVLVYSNETYAKVPLEAGLMLDAELSRLVASTDRARIYRRVEVYRTAAGASGSESDPSARVRRLRVV